MLRPGKGMRGLPIKAAYSLTELARASGVDRRTLKHLLRRAGVEFLASRGKLFVSISELESKARPLWDGIRAAHALWTSFR